jgi:hypothetical protein
MINKQRNNFDKLPDERLEQELEDLRTKLNSRLSRKQKKRYEGRIRSINQVLDARKEVNNVVELKGDNAVPVRPSEINIGEKLHLDKEITIERVGEKEYVITQIYYGETLSMNSSSLEDAIKNAKFLGADPNEIERVINGVKEAI